MGGCGYDFRARLTSIAAGSIQNLVLTYDDASNVKTVTDNIASETAAYDYDVLNRLTNMTINGSQAASYQYNTIGNMTVKNESLSGMLNSSNLTLAYPATGQAHPHAVSSTTGTQTLSMSYDADGNMTVHGSTIYNFDAENRLRTRGETGGIDVYSYDSRGELTKRANADGSSTVYVDGLYEKDSNGSVTTYYSVLGHRVAMRSAGTLYYLLADHLGSTVAVLDTTGAAVSMQRYWPYGATRAGGATQTDKLYTGQQMESGDAALGLYDYKARFYSTTLGRFVSADTVADGLNRYSYVRDNPVRYADPTGHCAYGLSCNWSDAKNWISCALSCGDNWLGALARAALNSNGFWTRFNRAFGEGGGDTISLFEVIAKTATSGSLHALFTNDFGANYLASIFGAGYRANYFEASLGDVLFGGNRRGDHLGIADIVGASNWSDSVFWALRLRTGSHQNDLNMEIVRRLSSAGAELARRTLSVAQDNAGTDLNGREWTLEQRSWLHDNGFSGITIPGEETSVWQKLADNAVGCVTDATCFGTWAWTTDWEHDWLYP